MTVIEYWIGVRMAAGYDDDDLRDAVELLRLRRDFAEVTLVESAEAPQQPRWAVEALTPYLRHVSPNCTPSGTDIEDRCVCGLTATLRHLHGGQWRNERSGVEMVSPDDH